MCFHTAEKHPNQNPELVLQPLGVTKVNAVQVEAQISKPGPMKPNLCDRKVLTDPFNLNLVTRVSPRRWWLALSHTYMVLTGLGLDERNHHTAWGQSGELNHVVP